MFAINRNRSTFSPKNCVYIDCIEWQNSISISFWFSKITLQNVQINLKEYGKGPFYNSSLIIVSKKKN